MKIVSNAEVFQFRDALDPHLLLFMSEEPFWGQISRTISKVMTRDVPTAGVGIRPDGTIALYWNPDCIEQLTYKQIRGLLIHEFMHVILEHITLRRKKPNSLWNIATDLAINSLINPELLPKFIIYPGPRPQALGPWQELVLPGKPPMTPEEHVVHKEMMDLLEQMAPKKTSEEYFELLKKKVKFEIVLGAGDVDSHDGWDDLDDATRDVLREQLRDIVGRAFRQCESTNTWGSCPSEMQSVLRDMLSKEVDWQGILRHFVGQTVKADPRHSIKRINRRYPYIHPGRTFKRHGKVVVYVDQSGSVGDQNVETMFGELNSLGYHVDFTVYPFDTSVDEKNRIDWRKGQRIVTKRVRCGGTDFNAPTKHFNESGEWDAMIIFSDGECSKPMPITHGRRAFIIVPNRKLLFVPDDSDVLVQMQDPKKQR